jgi:hypothetical protein
MRKRLLLVVAGVLLALYFFGPFVDGGIYLSRPYWRIVSWDDGIQGFGVCHAEVGPYHVAGVPRSFYCE